jgi:CubicO group peptidase (beta-lactamase class C family)
MPRRTAACVTLTFLLCAVGATSARAEDNPLKGLDEYITKSLRDWQVPGLAIVVVKDDKVVLAKGYGVRKLGETTPVDAHTLFAIGSCTKAFTAAALGLLVDDDKLKWDDPVSKYLPDFQLNDSYVTREITVRDLLSHRSGLDRHELVWYGAPIGREEVLRRMRHAKPSWSFRSKFGYQNVMFLAAGQIVPAITKQSWDEVVRRRLFQPLGMTASNTSTLDLAKKDNVASPHYKVEDKVQVVPWRNLDNVGPAGSINSSVTDMAQWVRLQLGAGKFQNVRLLSSGTIEEMYTPQTIIRNEGIAAKLNPGSHFLAYGLGWMLRDYRGVKIVEHGGGIDGMTALVALIPEKKLGLVVLTNLTGHSLNTALKYRIFDAYLGAPEKDWSGELLKAMKSIEDITKEAQKKQDKERVTGTKPSLALDKYAGTYKDKLYGELKVAHEKDKLVLRYGPAFEAVLEHWHYDTFRAAWKSPTVPKALITFRLDGHAKVEDLKVEVPGFGDVVVKRAASAADKSAAVVLSKDALRALVGAYESKSPPVDIKVELVGDKLKVVGTAGAANLVPLSATRFKLAGAPVDVFIQFEVAGGKVKSLTLEQKPSITLKLEPKK